MRRCPCDRAAEGDAPLPRRCSDVTPGQLLDDIVVDGARICVSERLTVAATNASADFSPSRVVTPVGRSEAVKRTGERPRRRRGVATTVGRWPAGEPDGCRPNWNAANP